MQVFAHVHFGVGSGTIAVSSIFHPVIHHLSVYLARLVWNHVGACFRQFLSQLGGCKPTQWGDTVREELNQRHKPDGIDYIVRS